MITQKDLEIRSLGKCMIPSPLNLSTNREDGIVNYISDQAKVRYKVSIETEDDQQNELLFEQAGPRKSIFFDPTLRGAQPRAQ